MSRIPIELTSMASSAAALTAGAPAKIAQQVTAYLRIKPFVMTEGSRGPSIDVANR